MNTPNLKRHRWLQSLGMAAEVDLLDDGTVQIVTRIEDPVLGAHVREFSLLSLAMARAQQMASQFEHGDLTGL